MATITQLAPTSDSINGEATGFYENFVNVSGVVTQPAVFITITQSPALYVAPNGAISTTGTLENGTYTSAGTVSDAAGNNGTWVFTLTVVGVPSAQVALIPQIPVPPTGSEIAVPFQIDPATGALAVVTSYNQIIAQHVTTIVLTEKTERLMLPDYGSDLPKAVFGSTGSLSNTLLAKDIQAAITAWEPAVNIVNVTISTNSQSLSELDITVSYSLAPFNDVSTVTVTTGGTISQVNAP
jgi:phage baseplate assembly protein W